MTTTIRVWIAVLIVTALMLPGVLFSAGKPNPNHGKTLYRETCKTCHVKDGGAKDLAPLSKTQAQWDRFFKTSAPVMVKRVETKTHKTLSPGDLADMQEFLVSHAADSDHPETCGIK